MPPGAETTTQKFEFVTPRPRKRRKPNASWVRSKSAAKETSVEEIYGERQIGGLDRHDASSQDVVTDCSYIQNTHLEHVFNNANALVTPDTLSPRIAGDDWDSGLPIEINVEDYMLGDFCGGETLRLSTEPDIYATPTLDLNGIIDSGLENENDTETQANIVDWIPEVTHKNQTDSQVSKYKGTTVSSPQRSGKNVQHSTPFNKLYLSLHSKLDELLTMYDQTFCVLPITSDFPLNPFRCRQESPRRSEVLLHGILALACHHAGRQSASNTLSGEVQVHKNIALQHYQSLIDGNCDRGDFRVQDLFEAVLVLFTLDATQSAIGSWLKHLSNAKKLLELSGGTVKILASPRMQAQVTILLWWDTTIALLSRQGCVLPYSYFEALLAREDEGNWSFFAITGCPRNLLVPMIQLAHLTLENEQVKRMRHATFDVDLIAEIETSIINCKFEFNLWEEKNPEEKMQLEQDQMNCCEAWRSMLLLYICRVFRWNRSLAPPKELTFLARKTLNYIRACRQTSLISKQLLLAVFMTGMETKDRFCRQSVLEYCHWWQQETGYWSFAHAGLLLEDIWAEQDENGEEAEWWGSIVDRKHREFSQNVRYKFG